MPLNARRVPASSPLAQLKGFADALGVPLDARNTEGTDEKRQAAKRKHRSRTRERIAKASRRRNRR